LHEIPDLIFAHDAVKILATSLELIDRGRPEFYRVAALQLRLLLCDTTRRHNRIVDISLAKRVWPGLRLRLLAPPGAPDLDSPPVPLGQWLAQRLPAGPDATITVRELIRRVCDQQGGAHVDVKPNAGVQNVVDVPGWIYEAGIEVCRGLAESK